jgi:hypothetical protein
MAAIEGSTAKRTGNSAQVEEAIELLDFCANDIYALDNIGRRFVGNPFTPMTIAHVVSALAESIRSRLKECDKLLPGPMVHPAHLETAEAFDTLTALEEFMVSMTDDDDLKTSEQTIGMAIYEMTVRTARAIERAELACGAPVTATEYLKGNLSDPCRRPSETALNAQAQ